MQLVTWLKGRMPRIRAGSSDMWVPHCFQLKCSHNEASLSQGISVPQAKAQQPGGNLSSTALRTALWLIDDLPALLERMLNRDPRGPGLVPAHFYPEGTDPLGLQSSGVHGTHTSRTASSMQALKTGSAPIVAPIPSTPALGYLRLGSGEL